MDKGKTLICIERGRILSLLEQNSSQGITASEIGRSNNNCELPEKFDANKTRKHPG